MDTQLEGRQTKLTPPQQLQIGRTHPCRPVAFATGLHVSCLREQIARSPLQIHRRFDALTRCGGVRHWPATTSTAVRVFTQTTECCSALVLSAAPAIFLLHDLRSLFLAKRLLSEGRFLLSAIGLASR